MGEDKKKREYRQRLGCNPSASLPFAMSAFSFTASLLAFIFAWPVLGHGLYMRQQISVGTRAAFKPPIMLL